LLVELDQLDEIALGDPAGLDDPGVERRLAATRARDGVFARAVA
jgi:hypothetical protein